MSTINVDTISDSDGTGKPDFSNGLTSSGNVGIGTSSPAEHLEISAAANNFAKVTATNSNTRAGYLSSAKKSDGTEIKTWIRSEGDSGVGVVFTQTNHNLGFATNNAAPQMTLDTSGNLLVGTSGTNWQTTAGLYAFNQSALNVTRSGAESMNLNRLSSDGDIAKFFKDGTTVGSVGNSGANVYLANSATGLGVSNSSNMLFPINGDTGEIRDNAIDLGRSNARFDDIFATNGTIQTSDRNEKQQIAALTTAEITAAKAISAGFKTFKWNDSVAEKGAEARTHSGVIAQEVEQALTDAGLDAGDYAFFISNTWWETHTEVPAVEAVAEVLDAEGVVITEAVEAKEAYTRTENYDTLAEAPEGATERTRKGIRYPQLLAFVGAATEQRLASIETRLTALEE